MRERLSPFAKIIDLTSFHADCSDGTLQIHRPQMGGSSPVYMICARPQGTECRCSFRNSETFEPHASAASNIRMPFHKQVHSFLAAHVLFFVVSREQEREGSRAMNDAGADAEK